MSTVAAKMNSARFVIDVVDLTKHYVLPRESLFDKAHTVEAVHRVSFRIRPGQSLGLVGESGCGKSTLARLVTGLENPTSGSVHIAGFDIHQLSHNSLRKLRTDFQIVFQDPFGSAPHDWADCGRTSSDFGAGVPSRSTKKGGICDGRRGP